MQLADSPLPLQFASHIHRQQAVRIPFHIGRIVAAMHIVVLHRIELLLAFNAEARVGVHRRRWHTPHRIALEDALLDASGAPVGMDLKHIGHAWRMLPRGGARGYGLDL